MGRYIGSVCRFCRREGEKLFLKGERCFTAKCAYERRSYPPGQHGRGRQAFSNYKLQLRAKQKIKRTYGVLERQFRIYYSRAAAKKGVTGTLLLIELERRLDNVAYLLGFGSSRRHARQLVRHGKISVNGRVIDLPSYQVKEGDVVEVVESYRSNTLLESSLKTAESRGIPQWLSLERESFKGSVLAMPTREQIPHNFNEQLVVELYSK